MRIQSPLSNLCEILDQVKAAAQQYKATLLNNEAATRAVLIDPVLRALGWDTADTTRVDIVQPLTGISYTQEDYNGQTVYVRTNYSANDCIANTIHILGYLPAGSSIAAEVAF